MKRILDFIVKASHCTPDVCQQLDPIKDIKSPACEEQLLEIFTALQSRGCPPDRLFNLFVGLTNCFFEGFSGNTFGGNLDALFNTLNKAGASIQKDLDLYEKILEKIRYATKLNENFQALINVGASLETHKELYELVINKDYYYQPYQLGAGFAALIDAGASFPQDIDLFKMVAQRCVHGAQLVEGFSAMLKAMVSFQTHRALFDAVIKDAASSRTLSTNAAELGRGFAILMSAGISSDAHPKLYNVLISNAKDAVGLAHGFVALGIISASFEQHPELYDELIKKYKERTSYAPVKFSYGELLHQTFSNLFNAGATLEKHRKLYEDVMSSPSSNDLGPLLATLLGAGFSLETHEEFYQEVKDEWRNPYELNQAFIGLSNAGASLTKDLELFKAVINKAKFGTQLGQCISILHEQGCSFEQHRETYTTLINNIDNMRCADGLVRIFLDLKKKGISFEMHQTLYESLVTKVKYAEELSSAFAVLEKMGVSLAAHPELYALCVENISSLSNTLHLVQMQNFSVPEDVNYLKAVLSAPKVAKSKFEALEKFGFDPRSQSNAYKAFITEDISLARLLLNDLSLLPSLLKLKPDNTSPLYLLATEPDGRKELKELLMDEDGRRAFLSQADFLTAFLARKTNSPGKNTSPLFWLVGSPELEIILKELSNEDFQNDLVSHPQFLQTLIAPVDKPNENTSALFWLAKTTPGVLRLEKWFSNPKVIESISTGENLDHFVTALMINASQGNVSAFSQLLGTPTGCNAVRHLLANPLIRTKIMQHFNIPEKNQHVDWMFQSPAGLSLFRFLFQQQRLDLLNEHPARLITHPDIQVYIRLGKLDPNLFLLLAAGEKDDESFLQCLENPLCTPWATSELGHSIADMIRAAPLDTTTKERRIRRLEQAMTEYTKRISDHSFVTHPNALGSIHHQAPEQPIPPELPAIDEELPYTIDGLDNSIIQSFRQHIAWILSQPELHAYHRAFRTLSLNKVIRNANDYPAILENIKTLCSWMNEYIEHQRRIPEPYPEWIKSLSYCDEGVTTTFGEMFTEFSRQSDLARYVQQAQNDANAFYCRLLAIPSNMEVHIPKQAIQAEMGRVSTLPRFDVYLRNLNRIQRRWSAQYAMQMLIQPEQLVHHLVSSLDIPESTLSYEQLMEKYHTSYKYSPIFGRPLSETEFMTFITNRAADDIIGIEPTFSVRRDLRTALEEKALSFLYTEGVLTEKDTRVEERELLWRFLTAPNLENLSAHEHRLATNFLKKCSMSADGLAFIKDCIESHVADITKINPENLFFCNDEGDSIFSLMISSPYFSEWLFGYHLVVTRPNTGTHEQISFHFEDVPTSPMKPLAQALLALEKTKLALEPALTQRGTLPFWLYYFQGDGLRGKLHNTLIKFMMQSPNGLYTYDALPPLLYDIQTNPNASAVEKTLVTSFVEEMVNGLIQTKNDACWLTAAILNATPAKARSFIVDKLLPTLRQDPWLLQTLENPKHWETFCFIAGHDENIIRDVLALRQQHSSPRSESHSSRFFPPAPNDPRSKHEGEQPQPKEPSGP